LIEEAIAVSQITNISYEYLIECGIKEYLKILAIAERLKQTKPKGSNNG